MSMNPGRDFKAGERASKRAGGARRRGRASTGARERASPGCRRRARALHSLKAAALGSRFQRLALLASPGVPRAKGVRLGELVAVVRSRTG